MSLPNNKMHQPLYNVHHAGGHAPIKIWNKFVAIEQQALAQLFQTASMPFVKPWVAAMPDTHFGMGATVGSVVPTEGAVMPAAVGVDIGCGMMAVRTNLREEWIGHADLVLMFESISKAVPHGRTDNGGGKDIGAWPADGIPSDIQKIWDEMFQPRISGTYAGSGPKMFYYDTPFSRHPGAISKNGARHLGTLGTGNHFIELCVEIDNPDSNIWVVIHSGSRGLGNRIGSYFTKLAGELCAKWHVALPNKDLGYFPAGTQEFDDYISCLDLAQKFAWQNREIMMRRVLDAIGAGYGDAGYTGVPVQIHMHHNYADIRGTNILTRKGAVDASAGKFVIIPGSMGAKTYIALGLGSKESFNSCSHGAGRAMSRTQALKTFSVEDHVKATEGVYCDKTVGVLDETPAAYKDIDAVMESQRDLVEPILKLKQIVCVKGLSE